MQSLRRLLLYSNEFRMAGLIASASGIPGELGEAVTHPELILDIVNDYAADYPSLREHDQRYPHPDSLRRLVRSGSALRGPSHLGADRRTPGSEHIIAVVVPVTGSSDAGTRSPGRIPRPRGMVED